MHTSCGTGELSDSDPVVSCAGFGYCNEAKVNCAGVTDVFEVESIVVRRLFTVLCEARDGGSCFCSVNVFTSFARAFRVG